MKPFDINLLCIIDEKIYENYFPDMVYAAF
jgi:hypothetical protein